MHELTIEQIDAVSGGYILGAIAVITFFSSGGYQNAIDFTSGAIEGFMDAR